MKKNTLILVLVLVLLSTLACKTLQGGGSIPATEAPYEEPTVEEPATGSGGNDVMDLTGTTWTTSHYDNVTNETYTYTITFLPGGKLANTHPNDTTPDNDTWKQDGSTVYIYFNNAYATYTGVIDGDSMSGTATNVTGSTWDWTATLNN